MIEKKKKQFKKKVFFKLTSKFRREPDASTGQQL